MDSIENAVVLLSADIDGTLLGDTEGLAELGYFLQTQEKAEIIFSYNTGRTVEKVIELIQQAQLPEADYIIGGVGTRIYSVQDNSYLPEFTASFSDFDREKIHNLLSSAVKEIKLQDKGSQSRYKLSYTLSNPNVIHRVKTKVENTLISHTIDARVLLSSHIYLDILPAGSGKGPALKWLAEYLGIPHKNIIAAGDSANDKDMLSLYSINPIVVSNSLPELIEAMKGKDFYLTKLSAAQGVLEGVKHFLQTGG
ncbi:MAG: HAD-IIB family hydrolase [Spirochaetia bacterium]